MQYFGVGVISIMKQYNSNRYEKSIFNDSAFAFACGL